jgi:Xaa-Pro aminopeptidase
MVRAWSRGCIVLLAGLLPVLPGLAAPAGPAVERAQRREVVARLVGAGGILVVPSAPSRRRNGDVDYEFRQDDTLLYLTGIAQEDTTLVLVPGNDKLREILFLAPRDPEREIWNGRRLTTEEAKTASGVENIWPSSEFEPFLDAVLTGGSWRVGRYAVSHEYEAFRGALRDGRAEVWLPMRDPRSIRSEPEGMTRFAARLRERFVGITIRNVLPALAQQRLRKSPAEIETLRRAVDISVDAHREAMRLARPGLMESDVEAAIEYVFRRQGASGWSYPSIVGSGPNATILHYEENSRALGAGELLLMDAGAEFGGYAADVTRTVPISGRFSADQAAIYAIVLEAQEAALREVKPGSSIPQVHARAEEVIRNGLLRLGLITDAKGDQFRSFFMHGTCHWLGLDVHDVGDRDIPLEPGMILTVEPGLYLRADAFDALPDTEENRRLKQVAGPVLRRFAGIGVRIEDDVLVTGDGHEILSAGAPRGMKEIEALMSAGPEWVVDRR